ncbi:MAG: hypothetical protein UT33_C0007G0065 [Candidatus Peregrinibacteria bacterium GW2011_GWC2_39_14]|nr:MAG: hypothetical protein US92_C0002G0066 [Candidatus Peregrinibacteria bacterium GW2011_GWA2_38_36]KKR06877.1 MAG: hypothetical protein UT33_C0007G0065 [Candidatus Peregrinibacteria bacterium GW2011_GWC2_39_14]
MTNVAQNTQKILEKDLHEKFTFYGKNALKWKRKCTILLPEIAKYRIWEKKGFSSIYEYAAKLAGINNASVNVALWAMRKIEDKPELKRVVEEKGIEIIRPIANIATPETAAFWAEKAMGMSKNTLAAYAKEYKKSELGSPCADSKNYYENQTLFSDLSVEQITMDLSPETAEQLQKLKGQGNWNELMQKLLQAYQARVEAKKPIPQENAKRYVPAKIEKYVLAKTNNTCAFPGCTKEYKYLHHTWRFALTKTHDPDTLIPLCKPHERLAHAGLIENENQPPENWKIKLEADKTSEKWLKVDKWVAEHYAGKNAGT